MSRSPVAICVENLGKRYRIGARQRQAATLRDQLGRIAASPFGYLVNATRKPSEEQTLWALREVSFTVEVGEVVGIIGRNGSGKSTLLKILARITRPTEGQVRLYGRVGALLEVGTGFHAELTGRENIYFNGSMMGMSRAEIKQRFDAIVDFAGIERFIDTPVKFYSSGMYVRLGFSVAAHLQPEILAVDEVLAVGDTDFQRKCLGKMEHVAQQEGRTVLFVSHNMAAVQSLCRRGIVLDQGRIHYIGDQAGAITEYLRSFDTRKQNLLERADREGSGALRVVGIRITDAQGKDIDIATSGQDIEIHLSFQTAPGFDSDRVIASLKLATQLDVPVFLHHNRLTREEFGKLPESGDFVFSIPRLPLPSSIYRVTYHISADGEMLDGITGAYDFTVAEGSFFGSSEVPPVSHGVCLVDGHWRVVPNAASDSLEQVG
jgi:lipopolysaccharide transport system ATP-binding protein